MSAFANIEFNGIPLRIGLGAVAIGGTALIGDADIDTAGRVISARLVPDAAKDSDICIERGSPMWEEVFKSIEVGCSEQIAAATAAPDETWDSYVAEHTLRKAELV